MKLLSITIKNFRSIRKATFKIKEVDGTRTFTLIGVNESGKSSFLEAISLLDSDVQHDERVSSKDYYDKTQEIDIELNYELDSEDNKSLKKRLLGEGLLGEGFDKKFLSKIVVQKVAVCANFKKSGDTSEKKILDKIKFQKKVFSDYTLIDGIPVKKDPKQTQQDPKQTQQDFNLADYFEQHLPKYFWQTAPRVVFWKSDSKHLIRGQIDLSKFASDPKGISIPLANCFALAREDGNQIDIATEIRNLETDADKKILEERLSDSVTAHINTIWPDHLITIKFRIDNMQLSFLIEDKKVSYQYEIIEQRSDGFRQFISFLLTISAENTTGQLSNHLLLLDEPETHLHPRAQECLRDELIKITKNAGNNNIIFFATHSNYMIDKKCIERCFKVSKSNGKTDLKQINKGQKSYAEVNYEVFDIPTTDYHNELYGYLECKGKKSDLKNLQPRRCWKREEPKPKNGPPLKEEKVSLSTYIRNSIHHPENNYNERPTEDELKKSIEIMQKMKNDHLKSIRSEP